MSNTFTLSAPRFQRRRRIVDQLNLSQEMVNQFLSPKNQLQQSMQEDKGALTASF